MQAALWAILAAPFFISCNLRNISEEAKDMLQNPLLIYINQDLRGVQGRLLAKVCVGEISSPEQGCLVPGERVPLPWHFGHWVAAFLWAQELL